MSDITYRKWKSLWPTNDSYEAFGYTDGTTVLIWHDGDVFFSGSGRQSFEKLHPIVSEELRGIAREQRNSRRLLEAL